MRIVYISYLHPHIAPGGEQQIAFELLEESLAQGHDAYLISALDIRHEAIYGKPGAAIVPFPGRTRQFFYFAQHYDHFNFAVADWRSLDFLRILIEKLRPDVVHFHHYHRIGVEAFRIARLAAPKAVICLTFHEMMAMCHADGQMVTRDAGKLCREATPVGCNRCFPEIRPEIFILRAQRIQALLCEVDRFVFPSEFLGERFISWGLPPDKCVVIPNGQRDLAGGFDRHQHSSNVNRLGFFGQFIDNKGVDIVLAALILLAQERRVPPCGIVFELHAANKHFASTTFIQKITDLLGELRAYQSAIQVIDRGAYEREELSGRMATVDWVVVPSTWWEVFGLVASEAWMFGRPVLASQIGGLGERVRSDENGFTFPAGDIRSLAQLLENVVGNKTTWSRLNARVTHDWSRSRMLEAHTEIWREVRPEL